MKMTLFIRSDWSKDSRQKKWLFPEKEISFSWKFGEIIHFNYVLEKRLALETTRSIKWDQFYISLSCFALFIRWNVNKIWISLPPATHCVCEHFNFCRNCLVAREKKNKNINSESLKWNGISFGKLMYATDLKNIIFTDKNNSIFLSKISGIKTIINFGTWLIFFLNRPAIAGEW